ncbi:alpha/beta fold hydrolase [Runella sp.]|uniref:alpha/beta fold hydrolase n=1 Tax=Runella sp. TaxID=1960881 RepID=UPI003D145EFF
MRIIVFLSLWGMLAGKVSAQKTLTGLAAVANTKLYYEVEGKGEPVVFIHEMALDTRLWNAQWKAFARRFKVIRYDIRGFGQSARARDPHNPCEDLKALLDYLNIQKVNLIGLSLGGNVALSFAEKYPERVLKIVTADTNLDGFKDYTRQLSAAVENIIDLASHQGWHDEQQNVWLRSPLMRLYAADDKTIINLSEMIADYHGDHFINPRIDPTFGTPRTIDLLSTITAPTLVLVGEKDEESFHRMATLLAEKIPNVRKVIIKGAGHLSNLDKPKVFNKLAISFLITNPTIVKQY